MALVKKLQSGGSVINPKMLNSELEKTIGAYGLKSKDERKVRETLVKMRDYFKDDPEGKNISVDSLSKTYTITGPDSSKFTGSADDVKRGWLSGSLKIKDDQDVMSVAASIYNQALTNVKSTASQTSQTSQTSPSQQTEKRTILPWEVVATSKDSYGSADEFNTAFGQAHTDDERKKMQYDVAKIAVKNYLDEFNREGKSGKYDYSDVANAKELDSILSAEVIDWDKYLTTSRKLGWAPSQLLLNEDEKNRLKVQGEEQKSKDFDEFLKNQKLPNDIKVQLKAGNYTEQVSNYDFSSDEGINKWVSDLITQNKALVFKNPKSGEQVVVNDKGLFNFEQKNPYATNYGYSVGHDQYGFKIFKPEENKDKWQDEFAQSDTGKELITNLPGSVYGYSTNQQGETDYQKDIIGHRSFTKRLEWIKPDGTRVTLNLNDNNQYVDETGRPIDIKISGFGKNERPYVNDNNMFSAIPIEERRSDSPDKTGMGNFLQRIKPRSLWQAIGYTTFAAPGIIFSDAYKTLDEDVHTLSNYFTDNPTEINDEMGKVAGRIKWSLLHDKNVINNENKVKELRLLLADYDRRIKNQVLKNGGIIKAQNGTKLQSTEDYLKTLISQQQVSGPVEAETPKYKNTSGTWKGQSTEDNILDTVAIAGDVASFVPGVGAIGAATSMGASLVKDLKDGKVDDWGTHALNAGFVGLSLIGLGGLKALVKGAKVAKNSANIAKVGEKGSKIFKSKTEIEALNKFVKLSEREGLKTADDVVAKLSKEVNPGNKDIYEKGLKLVGEISDRSEAVLKNKPFASQIEQLSNFAGTSLGKKVFTGARVATIIPGVTSAYNIGKTAYSEGWEYTKPSDFRNVAIAGAVGKNWLKDRSVVNAINRQRIPGDITSEGKTVLNINGKPIELKTIINKEPLEKTRMGLKKGAIENNKKQLESLKDEIITAAKTEGKTITKEELKNLKYEDITTFEASKSNHLYLGDEPIQTTNNRYTNERDYELAKKTLDKLEINWKKPIEPPKKIKRKLITKGATNPKGKFIANAKYKYSPISNAPVAPATPVTPASNVITPKPSSTTTKKGRGRPKKNNNENVGKLNFEGLKPRKAINKNENGGVFKFQKGSIVNPKKPKEEKEKLFNIDSIDIANIAMAANATTANNRSAIAQKKAALAGIVTLPTMQKTYFRTASPVSLQAEKQAAETRSYARRLGSSTSDMSRAMDIRLKGNTEANNIVNKGNLIDLEANNKLGESQRLADSQINQYNLQVIGKNKTNIANAEKQIHLIDANKALAQSQTTNNLVTSLEKNLGRKDFMKLNKGLNKDLNSQEFLNMQKSYNDLINPEYVNKLKLQYLEDQKKLSGSKSNATWEGSPAYNTYIQLRDANKKRLDDFSQKLRIKQSQVKEATTNLMYRKAGGTLSKQDRIDLEYEKAKLRSLQKDKELSYKTILKSNELLQKALIKVFK